MKFAVSFIAIFILIAVSNIHAADEWEELFSDLNEEKTSAQGEEPFQSSSVNVDSSARNQNTENTVVPVSAASDFPEPAQKENDDEKNEALKKIEEEMARSAGALETKTQARPELGISAVLNSQSRVKNPAVVSGAIPSFDSSRDKIESLERRISDLERENRLMTERVRNLTRSVDDIKRKI